MECLTKVLLKDIEPLTFAVVPMPSLPPKPLVADKNKTLWFFLLNFVTFSLWNTEVPDNLPYIEFLEENPEISLALHKTWFSITYLQCSPQQNTAI